MSRRWKLAAIFVAAIGLASNSFGAEGKLTDWGPLKFGMSFEEVKSIAPQAKPLVPDDHDSEIAASQIAEANFAGVAGGLSARFYKNRAFEFTFFAVDGTSRVIPRASAAMSKEDKIAHFCPSAFEVALDLLSVSYGRADEILRPSDGIRLDRTQAKASRASWWFGDGSRARLVSNQPPNLGICTEFVSIKSARYAKAYVPEIVTSGGK